MILNTHLIAKHLPRPQGGIIPSCAMCGASALPGFPLKEIIGSGFMDHEYLGDSGYICSYCAACLGKGQPRNEALRNTSFIATTDELLRLKREDLWRWIIDPPDPPFVFCVTYTHKKHTSFKAPVNLEKAQYKIQTENGAVLICRPKIFPLLSIIQRWYSICRDIKTEPTWFTKRDILYSCTNLKKIEQYGRGKHLKENQFINEDQFIEPYRQTALLQLLVHALNKGEIR